MRVLIGAAALVMAGAAVAQTAPASAPAAAVVKVGATVHTADGRRIGRIDRVETRGGQQVASLIYQSHVVHIPVSTLSGSDNGVVTSLSRDDIK